MTRDEVAQLRIGQRVGHMGYPSAMFTVLRPYVEGQD